MGHYAIHVEGHGVHDNGDEKDADQRMQELVDTLTRDGHQVHAATFTSGSAKHLLNSDDTTPLRAGEHSYRHR